MAPQSPSTSYEQALQRRSGAIDFVRRLVVEHTPKSTNAILNGRALCEQELAGQCEIETALMGQVLFLYTPG